MHRKRQFKFILVTAGTLVIITSLWLGLASTAQAQCGSQASSCKNCHEVQGQDPVNTDGTAWHQSHAFGDFCYICHAGNNQATDIDGAHTGMVSPFADIKASCQQCHYQDLEGRAQVYASALGVDLAAAGSGSGDSGSADGGGASDAAPASSGIGLLAPIDLQVDDPNLVDYVQRYNIDVLGEKPRNLGNLIVGGMIGLVLLGGGAFVVYNEGWVDVDYAKVDQYPAEMVAMLPKISRLSSPARAKLDRLLANPHQANEILSKLDSSEE